MDKFTENNYYFAATAFTGAALGVGLYKMYKKRTSPMYIFCLFSCTTSKFSSQRNSANENFDDSFLSVQKIRSFFEPKIEKTFKISIESLRAFVFNFLYKERTAPVLFSNFTKFLSGQRMRAIF